MTFPFQAHQRIDPLHFIQCEEAFSREIVAAHAAGLVAS